MAEINYPLKVLLVDDDANILKTLSLSLKLLNCSVSQAASVEKAVEILACEDFDLILSDFRLGEKTGLELIQTAKRLRSQALVIVITAYASIENAIQVTKEGAFDYLAKPFTNAELAHLLSKVRLVTSLREENLRLKEANNGNRGFFKGFTSVASHRLEEFVQKISPSDATVLLVGESGTGKSELARNIHQQSRRAAYPFVTVNCTSLAESLFESEIFGHIKGAFTGAIQDHIGKFELANKGTLFLDEIGDISLASQAKLLRFLQEKVIERVGSNRAISVDTRIIAATNKNLEKAVKDGSFREDLYYRLNIFECTMVPLRFRREDIPVFIQRFISQFQQDSKDLKISTDVRHLMENYSWPGNIRELRNVVERLAFLSNENEVQISDLPDSVRTPPKDRMLANTEEKLKTLEELERDYIERLLRLETNQEKIANILGISTVTLWRKRKEYGLS